MRQSLPTRAAQDAGKRGGGKTISLDEAIELFRRQASSVIAVDDALQDLASIDAEQARLVELRSTAA